MKTLSVLFIVWMTVICANAQKPVRVFEDSLSYANHKYPGVTVTIPEANFETVQKNWKKELEARTKSRVVNENGEWSIFGANIKNISPTPVNIYSKFNKQDSLVDLGVAVELKKDVYVDSKSTGPEFMQLENYLKEFAKDQYIETVDAQLRFEEDSLHELKKELSDYQKSESNLNDDISSSEKTIKEGEDNLTALNSEIETLSAEIASENTLFSKMTDGPTKDDKAKYIKGLEKQNRKLNNDVKSTEEKISKANKTIREAKDAIPEKQRLQDEVKKKIADQESVVKKFELKLAEIKNY